MPKFFRSIHKRVALSPGTVEYVGEKRIEKVRVGTMNYDAKHLDEKKDATIDDCYPLRESPGASWIDVHGLHDTDLLQKLGAHFGLHPLVLEDVVNVGQRPKLEQYDDYLYLVIKMLSYDEPTNQVIGEQVSLILGSNYVLTFQEREGDVFDPVRDRIRGGTGRIRGLGPDYLAYALLDAIVDSYFLILERLSDRIEDVEQRIGETPQPHILQEIYALKREVIYLHKGIWPLRDVLRSTERDTSKLVTKTTSVFFRDVYDHTIQVAEAIESFRDLVAGLQDLHLSTISNKMNEVMKVLTIIATIFVPLTFIAGIYGMNFEYMPELGWKWSYPILWVIIGGVAGSMIMFFRRRGWF